MTPLITEMVRLSPEPETGMWFDMGSMTSTEAQRVPVETLLYLPFERTAIVGIDRDDTKFALWLLQGDGTVTVGGCTSQGKYCHPFAYVLTDEGLRYYVGDREVDQEEIMPAFRLVCAALHRIEQCSEAYRPTAKPNSLTNKRLVAKGKPPLIYDWHTVKLTPKSQSEPQGGTHASPRRHQCRGYWRKHPTKGKVWVKDYWRGDAALGTVFKDYEVPK